VIVERLKEPLVFKLVDSSGTLFKQEVLKLTWLELYDDIDLFFNPWSVLFGPFFGFENENRNSAEVEGKHQCDQMACQLLPVRSWGDIFMI